jgi:DNA-binding response OmpR family regulator
MSIPKLLVVEDDKNDLEMLMRVLRMGQFDTNIALTGEDAKRMLLDSHYDSMLLNLSLPDMNGLELLRWAQERWPGMPMHIVTGHDAPATRMDVFKAGACCLWAKPYDSAANLAVVNLLRIKQTAFEAGQETMRSSPRTTTAGVITGLGIIAAGSAYFSGSDQLNLISNEASNIVKVIGLCMAAFGSMFHGVFASDKTK